MITGTSDYGILFTRSSTGISGTYSAFGRYVDVGFPEISMDEIDMTSHGGGGNQDFVMSRLIMVSDFDVTLIMDSSAVELAYDDLAAGLGNWYKVTFPTNASKAAWNFEAFTKAVKVANSANAQSPGALTVIVSFRPTGGISSGLT